ncbi:MAG: CinA family protein [Pseudomonadota bacterium]
MDKAYAGLNPLAGQLVRVAGTKSLMVATAESCTGGLVAGAITEIAGSSAVFDRGFVTYSNAAKAELLGIDPGLIDRFGAVSGEVARAMAEGALARSYADIAISITGIAGPGGGSADKPVGLVWFGLAASGRHTRIVEHRFGDVGRSIVRALSAETALQLLIEAS